MELTDSAAHSFYQYSSMLICFAIFFGYWPRLNAIRHSQAGLPKLSWFLSLALSDLLIALNIAFGSVFLFANNGERTEVGCHFYAWISLGSGFANITSAAFNALDRHHRERIPGYEDKNALRKIVGVWMVCFTAAALPWMGFGEFDHATKDTAICLIDPQKSQTYIYSVAAIWFVVPVAIIYSAYAELASKSKEYEKMTTIARAFMLCYAPYAFQVIASSTFGITFSPFATAISHLFPKLLSVVNPYLYSHDPIMIKQLERHEKSNGKTE